MGKMNNAGSGAVAAEKWFRALGDGHRLRILDLLAETEMNAGELLEQVDVVQSTLSHHMKTLCESGLVHARKNGKWTLYTVDREAVSSAREYLTRYMEAVQAQDDKDKESVPAETKKKEKKSGADVVKKVPEETVPEKQVMKDTVPEKQIPEDTVPEKQISEEVQAESFADTSADTISYDTVIRKTQDDEESLRTDKKKAKGKEKAKDKVKDKSKKAKEKDKSGKGKDKKKKKDNRF